MTNLREISVSSLVNAMFAVARTKYHNLHVAWTDISSRLAGRRSLPIAMINLQRQGDLDLLLRCIEDESEANKVAEAADQLGANFIFHYQVMLSESWVVGCYEILRAFRQRDDESNLGSDAVSALSSFKTLLADLELLRMPIAKYEIAKDKCMKQPLNLITRPRSDGTTDNHVYDKNDPSRSHPMQTGISDRGSMMWLAIEHSVPRQYWIERRGLADRLLALGGEVVPAGILEAERAAASNQSV